MKKYILRKYENNEMIEEEFFDNIDDARIRFYNLKQENGFMQPLYGTNDFIGKGITYEMFVNNDDEEVQIDDNDLEFFSLLNPYNQKNSEMP